MKDVEQATLNLIETIHASQTYREYKEQEEILSANPELCERVRKFRGDNFRMQNDPQEDLGFDLTDHVRQENIELRKIPEVNAYLDAELALCRLIQRTLRTIVGAMDIQVPEI